MKIKALLIAVLLVAGASRLQAQHVRVRLSFPVSIGIGRPGPAPFSGTIWIGPEWQWRGGGYVAVPGYWARPRHYGAVWVPGYWRYTRWGYRWVPGRWRY